MKLNQEARKAKRRAKRKSLVQIEFIAKDKLIKAKQKWVKDYYESLGDYPTNKNKKRLTWSQIKKFLKPK